MNCSDLDVLVWGVNLVIISEVLLKFENLQLIINGALWG